MREVIAQDGRHFRLHPTQPDTLQVQDKAGARWRPFAEYHTEAEARGALAQLGRLQPTTQPEAAVNEVDWNQAPDWAQWWTQDRHGTCWFEAEPEYGFGSWHTPDKAATSRYAAIAYDGGPVVAIMRRADAGVTPPEGG